MAQPNLPPTNPDDPDDPGDSVPNPPPDPVVIIDSPAANAAFDGGKSVVIPFSGQVRFAAYGLISGSEHASFALLKGETLVLSGAVVLQDDSAGNFNFTGQLVVDAAKVGSGDSTLSLAIMAEAKYEIRKWPFDASGQAELNVHTLLDADPPLLEITAPLDGAQLPGDQDITAIVVGTASDARSWVTNVEVSLDRGPFRRGQPKGGGTSMTDMWSNWTAEVRIPQIENDPLHGKHIITVRATDNWGNYTDRSITVWVPFKYTGGDPTLESYLHDLIGYTTQHVSKDSTSTNYVSVEDLNNAFLQPFNRLHTDSEIQRIRTCIEVLQSYLGPERKRLALYPDAAKKLAAAETAYVRATYETLLMRIGTSYTEVRRARGEDDKIRKGLTDRLGIDPDKLDRLVLGTTDLNEDALEKLFGLVDTRRVPLDQATEPLLLQWQQAHLSSVWSEEDRADTANGGAGVPLVDPDLLSLGDFIPIATNAARELWKARWDGIHGENGRLAKLRTDWPSGETDSVRFDRLVALSPIGTMADLREVAKRQNTGIDITAALLLRHISLGAFTYLLQLRKIADKIPLLQDEWEALYSILVQAHKLELFPQWIKEEQEKGLSLDPKFFQLRGAMPIPGLFSTGVHATGTPPHDPDWTVQVSKTGASTQAYAPSATPASWLPSSRTSRWISLKADASIADEPGKYVYTTKFDLTDFDVESVRITAQIAVDDTLSDIRLNGRSLGLTCTGSSTLTTIDIAGTFRADINTLDFEVTNNGASPSGLRVDLVATASYNEAPLPPWRTTRTQRQAWERTLKARIDQSKALVAALRSAVDAAEQSVLPQLRDALLDAAGASLDLDGTVAPDALSEQFLIDFRGSAHERTTRVSQAIETLQTLLVGLRCNRSASLSWTSVWETWNLVHKTEDFDADWDWYGSYATWKAAMQVFLYPESFLLPSLWGRASSSLGEARSASFETHILGFFTGTGGTNWAKLPEAFEAYINELIPSMLKRSEDPPFPQNLFDRVTLLRDIVKGTADANGLLLNPEANESLATAYSRLSAVKQVSGVKECLYFAPMYIAQQLVNNGQFRAALDWYRLIYAYEAPLEKRKIYPGLRTEEKILAHYGRTEAWLRDTVSATEHWGLDPHIIATVRPNAYTRYTVMSIARCLLAYADSEFTRDSAESNAIARDLYLTALKLLGVDELKPIAWGGFLPNPIAETLRLRAQSRLSRLRSGRNIAGMKRDLPASIAQTGGTINLAAAIEIGPPRSRRPTQYRFATLIERAKQLANMASQMEATYLTLLERTDAANYDLLRANNDLELTRSTVRLQDLRIQEAQDGVTLARDQKARAQTQFDYYEKWIDDGWNAAEIATVASYATSGALKIMIAGMDAAIGVAGAVQDVSWYNPFSWFGGGAKAGLVAAKGVLAASLAGTEMAGQIAYYTASIQRREDEWKLQRAVAEKDIQIGNDQIVAANDHLATSQHERNIAALQQDHSQAIVTFLANKFTNAELYGWMSGVLGEVYGYFLQQATSVARMAEDQLAFERQDETFSYVKTDYWQPPSDGGGAASKDRAGLTGSARLLEDVTKLDQYAFLTNKRKLQLAATFSLARMAPLEFQRFRETGVLAFATPMARFDAEFPGHYLRLIKRVRISMVALIPPSQGVRATLSTTGLSRVVIGGDSFETAVIRRDPEEIAFVSPINATGVFELDSQPELLLPFEGMGVDTTWELQLPRPANPFDFSTIADVLLTIEYTALDDPDYRKQVIKQLDSSVLGEQAFSLASDFADQWYALNNPDQSTTPMKVTFSTRRGDFPPNILDDSLVLENVALYFARADGSKVEVTVDLRLGMQDGDGSATSVDGIISTRRGNAAAWMRIIGEPVVGEWTLTLPNTEEMKKQFKGGQISDILLVLSYSGQLPPWPGEVPTMQQRTVISAPANQPSTGIGVMDIEDDFVVA